MKVKITSDSTCDLSARLLEQYDIDLLPVTVSLGSRDGNDGVDIFPDDIYSYVDASGLLPRTSATNVSEYVSFFSQWTERGYGVVHFCLGSGFSSTYQNACLAAKECGRVFVVDSANLSAGQGLLLLKGAELAQSGQSAEAIRAICSKAASDVEASFVIDSLDYLHKGGRCSGLAALGANILNLKPCIEVRGGVMLPARKYRGPIERVTLRYIEERLQGRTDIDTHRIFITHTRCPAELVQSAAERVRELLPDAEEVLETTAGATVTTHCGPNTLGVLFFRRPQDS